MSIIKSLLDVDFYKFTMGLLVFLKYRNVDVRYGFTCRTKDVSLGKVIDFRKLKDELDQVFRRQFNNSELYYLRGTNEYQKRMFGEEYLNFLKSLQLPKYDLRVEDDNLKLEFEGNWSEAIYWETIALSIINELYYQAQLEKMSAFEREVIFSQGRIRLMEKIKILKNRPDIKFIEFGTRRRFSRDWQDYVVSVLANELPRSQFLGTSNTYLAMKYGLVPMGTSAHELYMAYTGIYHGSDDEIRNSHNKSLQEWWDLYGYGLSVALTDTFGSDFFFRDMTEEQAHNWKGLRQDSGDPIEFGEKAIKFYQNYGIDPREKLIIFSDGLDIRMIIKLADHFKGRIKVSFGWGTNLTNDLGLKPLSMVIKLIESNGYGTVKLSDNLAKATGNHKDVERFKKIFGHTVTMNEATTY